MVGTTIQTAITATNLHERLPVGGGDELVRLARVVNDLLDRLEQAFELQRRFMADASHELRTPTAIVRTEADVTLSKPVRHEAEYRESVTIMQDASRRLTRIVDDLFLLARSDAGHLVVHRATIHLEDVVDDTVRSARPLADTRGVRMDLTNVVEAPLQGDADLLGRLLLNLLDNAIKHSAAGGQVAVTMERDGDAVRVTVTDQGEGIPAALQGRVFERFYKVDRARQRGLGGTVALDPEAKESLVRLSVGDARKALTALEAAAALARSRAGDSPRVSAEDVSTAVDSALVRYDKDGDQHYDVISAFIKSVRGSDADAALHYLARMIEAGEDPRFITRRLIILASEDIGLADPPALTLAVSAAQAVALIGMPEGRIPLAEVTVYLALAPKSNASYVAINEAQKAIREGGIGEVPAHLRDSHYPGAGALGHGSGYVYPHDDPSGIVPQQYSPQGASGTPFYRPTSRGFEAELGKRQDAIRRILQAP